MPEPPASIPPLGNDLGLAAEGAVPKLRLVMMGTGPFAVPSFEALRRQGHEICAVYTRPDRQGPGKKMPPPSPVRAWAQEHGLQVLAPESINTPESVSELIHFAPDLLVVCDYGQILKANVLETAKCGGINLHGSLLPSYRGAAPVQWAVLNGDTRSGVSVIHMTAGLDAGPIITSSQTPIGAKETAGELEERLSQLGIEATLQAVRKIAAARTEAGVLPADTKLGTPQEKNQVSKAPRLSKADGEIHWDQPASRIDAWIRGMQPWPTAYTSVLVEGQDSGDPNRRIVLLDTDILPEEVSEETKPGSLRVENGELSVASADRWIRVNRLKPAGRKEMHASDWLRGRPLEGLDSPAFS